MKNIKKGQIISSSNNKNYMYYVSKLDINRKKYSLIPISQDDWDYLIKKYNKNLRVKHIKKVIMYTHEQCHTFDENNNYTTILTPLKENIIIKINHLLDGFNENL